ncbi:MAG: DUF4412 domain-containing protein [Candidatus Aminicenantaceae bacterium]
MKKICILVLTLFFFAGIAGADIYIKQKTHTDAVTIMGRTQPAKDDIQETWIGKDRYAIHSSDSSSIIDQKKKVFYLINHTEKTYIPMTLPINLEDYMPEQMAGMMDSIKVNVTPLGQKKKIQNWTAEGYEVVMNVMMMEIKMLMWATKDVPFDWKDFNTNMMANMLKTQMRLSDEAVQELMKIEGFAVASETSTEVMGQTQKTTTEVVEISKKTPDASVYQPPAGYTKQDKFSMKDMRK